MIFLLLAVQDGEAVLDLLHARAKAVLESHAPPATRAELDKAAPELRAKLRTSLGLERLGPAKPRDVRRVGTLDRGAYVVDKLVYETLPGAEVPAHLYRPPMAEAPLPALLFVPGHWYEDSKTKADFQAFCASMALRGFMVLAYDPFGQGERGVSQRDHRRHRAARRRRRPAGHRRFRIALRPRVPLRASGRRPRPRRHDRGLGRRLQQLDRAGARRPRRRDGPGRGHERVPRADRRRARARLVRREGALPLHPGPAALREQPRAARPRRAAAALRRLRAQRPLVPHPGQPRGRRLRPPALRRARRVRADRLLRGREGSPRLPQGQARGRRRLLPQGPQERRRRRARPRARPRAAGLGRPPSSAASPARIPPAPPS